MVFEEKKKGGGGGNKNQVFKILGFKGCPDLTFPGLVSVSIHEASSQSSKYCPVHSFEQFHHCLFVSFPTPAR